MTGIQHALGIVFHQLNHLLQHLPAHHYKQACHTLMGASIGQHTRHIIEMMQCLAEGYLSGTVNYENRKRDLLLETCIQTAKDTLGKIEASLPSQDKAIQLEVRYHPDSQEHTVIQTNYFRELIYNIEHAIHHMAQIRTGVQEVAPIELPSSFGVASSTLKYREQCAQ
ncbi:hypothetical protein [Parasegetibacter sp. NRK P23]|uniref:hypothetical protein n=1 Tax=Parasegetibacter sp. NRK P23 TaxID=2942999 RepID=UPI002043AA9C|nr:hypothetical protein [Parasegetibacter sp. NRK P23]MCM5530463.1 hypothetical protein [Parasegetibacter sp. NRK P23]